MSETIRNKISIFIACHRPELVTGGRYFLFIICFMLFGVGVARPQSPDLRGTANNQNITALNIGDQNKGVAGASGPCGLNMHERVMLGRLQRTARSQTCWLLTTHSRAR